MKIGATAKPNMGQDPEFLLEVCLEMLLKKIEKRQRWHHKGFVPEISDSQPLRCNMLVSGVSWEIIQCHLIGQKTIIYLVQIIGLHTSM